MSVDTCLAFWYPLTNKFLETFVSLQIHVGLKKIYYHYLDLDPERRANTLLFTLFLLWSFRGHFEVFY